MFSLRVAPLKKEKIFLVIMISLGGVSVLLNEAPLA